MTVIWDLGNCFSRRGYVWASARCLETLEVWDDLPSNSDSALARGPDVLFTPPPSLGWASSNLGPPSEIPESLAWKERFQVLWNTQAHLPGLPASPVLVTHLFLLLLRGIYRLFLSVSVSFASWKCCLDLIYLSLLEAHYFFKYCRLFIYFWLLAQWPPSSLLMFLL